MAHGRLSRFDAILTFVLRVEWKSATSSLSVLGEQKIYLRTAWTAIEQPEKTINAPAVKAGAAGHTDIPVPLFAHQRAGPHSWGKS